MFTGLSGRADYTRVDPERPRTRSHPWPIYFPHEKQVPVHLRTCIVGGVAAAVVLLGGCEGDKHCE